METKGELRKKELGKYPGSVLLRDHIIDWVNQNKLIVLDPYYKDIGNTFDPQQLRKAKYDVRLGKAYYQAERYHILDDKDPLLRIEPYELVFVESYEVFDMPKNIVAVYDLRISGCLGGLGLQTGLQLDPEYRGRFFCPLFNFSDTRVTLTYKHQLASVQFIYTTTPKTPEDDSIEKTRQPMFTLSDALPDVPRRSGLERLYGEIQKAHSDITIASTRMQSEMQEARMEMRNINGIFLAVIGLAVTIIGAVQVPQAIGRIGTTPWWGMVIIGAVVVALVYLLLKFISSRLNRNR